MEFVYQEHDYDEQPPSGARGLEQLPRDGARGVFRDVTADVTNRGGSSIGRSIKEDGTPEKLRRPRAPTTLVEEAKIPPAPFAPSEEAELQLCERLRRVSLDDVEHGQPSTNSSQAQSDLEDNTENIPVSDNIPASAVGYSCARLPPVTAVPAAAAPVASLAPRSTDADKRAQEEAAAVAAIFQAVVACARDLCQLWARSALDPMRMQCLVQKFSLVGPPRLADVLRSPPPGNPPDAPEPDALRSLLPPEEADVVEEAQEVEGQESEELRAVARRPLRERERKLRRTYSLAGALAACRSSEEPERRADGALARRGPHRGDGEASDSESDDDFLARSVLQACHAQSERDLQLARCAAGVVAAASASSTALALDSAQWSQDIYYGDHYDQIKKHLGTDPSPQTMLRTRDRMTLTFGHFANFEGPALNELFPIQICLTASEALTGASNLLGAAADAGVLATRDAFMATAAVGRIPAADREQILLWLLQVGVCVELRDSVLHHAVLLLDRFCAASPEPVPVSRLQLIVVAILGLAMKVGGATDEPAGRPRGLRELLLHLAGTATAQEIFKAERKVLVRLQFNITTPSPQEFLDAFVVPFQGTCPLTSPVRILASFLVQLALLEAPMLYRYPHAVLAAGATYVALWCTRAGHQQALALLHEVAAVVRGPRSARAAYEDVAVGGFGQAANDAGKPVV